MYSDNNSNFFGFDNETELLYLLYAMLFSIRFYLYRIIVMLLTGKDEATRRQAGR